MAERWIARGLLAIILSWRFPVYLSKLFNDWNGRFYNALQDKNAEAFWVEIQATSAFLAFIFIVVAVYRIWLRQYLQIRWRRWLTGVYTRTWLGERTYYRMELTGHGTDNPEQRIEQDIADFTSQTLFSALDCISEVMTLVTFSVILWKLSGSLIVPILGGVQIPGYMMWVAVVYAADRLLADLQDRPAAGRGSTSISSATTPISAIA